MTRITKIFIYVPLISLVLFNLIFILLNLKDPIGFYWQFRQIVQNDLLGAPLVLLFIVILLIFLYSFVWKKNRLRFFQLGFFVLLLYFIAFNLSLFPGLNRLNHRSLETFFTLKKDASLDEAIEKSFGRFGGHIKNYLKLNTFLEDKTLIFPPSSEIKDDYFFHVLVRPKSIITKDYEYHLSEEEVKELNTFKVISFPAFYQLWKISEYRKIESSRESDICYLFVSGKTIFFVPEDIALQQILKAHD